MPIEFKQAVLDNGLTVIGEVDETAHTAAVGFFVKTGARDEDAAVMGVSHFLEHMMFKGSETRTAESVDLDFDRIGADHNAFTTSEMTAFFAACLPEHLPRAEEILSDIMRPALRQDDFDDEKPVILEEIAMYRDHPFWVLYERAMEEYYGAHPLSHRVLGTADTVSALTREQMAGYLASRYSADNTVVALAGNLDFDDFTARIADHCGHWPRRDAARAFLDTAPETSEFTVELPGINRHYLLMIGPGPAMDDDRRYAASMLMQILGDTDGSRLYWALVEPGLAEEAQAQYEPRDGTGEIMLFACCSPDDAEEVERIAVEQMDALIDSVTEDDLERVRSRVLTSATLHGELPSGRMRRIGRLWTYTGTYRALEEELARMDAVTLDDLRAVHEAFPCKASVIGRLRGESA